MALRSEGLLMRQIAERMGVAVSTVDSWLNDPDGSRLRARKDSYRGTCEVCGARTDGSAGRRAPTRCAHHNGPAEANREAGMSLAEEMLVLRVEGLTNREIAERLGVHPASVARSLGRLRATGVEIPIAPWWRRAAA